MYTFSSLLSLRYTNTFGILCCKSCQYICICYSVIYWPFKYFRGIMETISAPGHQHNGFVLTHALKDLESVYHVSRCTNCHKTIAVITGRAHSLHNLIYCAPFKQFVPCIPYGHLYTSIYFLKPHLAASWCLNRQEYLFILSFGGAGALCLNFVCPTIESVSVPRK